MNTYGIIRKKRDGFDLSFDEINDFIKGYLCGEIPDYQISALLMAIYFNGMTDRELFDLTTVMANSGDVLDLSVFGNLSVDKHSTGGVGDKTTLVVAPIVAVLGCKVAKMSGRGLGFTGGTVDKLASIPGYNVTLDNDVFLRTVERVGVSVVGQSENLTPADKRIYALRDVTATVDCLPLIASSVMSKKIAAGAKNIVLDVKYGTGAFMKTPDSAVRLAELMINIGKKYQRNTAAVISDMNTPLGFAIGNNLEVIEAVNLLRGADIPDLFQECITVSSVMVSITNGISLSKAEELCVNALKSGAAYCKFKDWISAQGGDISFIENTERFPKCKFSSDVLSDSCGFITHMNAETIGNISFMLGAGRKTANDSIDYSAGIILHKKTGDRVEKGECLCRLYTDRVEVIDKAKSLFLNSLAFSDNKPEKTPQIYKIIL